MCSGIKKISIDISSHKERFVRSSEYGRWRLNKYTVCYWSCWCRTSSTCFWIYWPQRAACTRLQVHYWSGRDDHCWTLPSTSYSRHFGVQKRHRLLTSRPCRAFPRLEYSSSKWVFSFHRDRCWSLDYQMHAFAKTCNETLWLHAQSQPQPLSYSTRKIWWLYPQQQCSYLSGPYLYHLKMMIFKLKLIIYAVV